MYYTVDAVQAVLLVLIMLQIEVTPQKTEKQSFNTVFKRIASPIFVLLTFELLVYGILYSMVQYYIIYAQEVLGASSKIIGMCVYVMF